MPWTFLWTVLGLSAVMTLSHRTFHHLYIELGSCNPCVPQSRPLMPDHESNHWHISGKSLKLLIAPTQSHRLCCIAPFIDAVDRKLALQFLTSSCLAVPASSKCSSLMHVIEIGVVPSPKIKCNSTPARVWAATHK